MDHQANITESDLECMLLDETAEPKPLPFSVLERITNGFSYKMEIGRGGFAVVYKGMLENGPLAVKRLTNTYKYENEFFREVECLMKIKHKNIVRFLGYCVDTQGNMIKHEGKFVMADIQQRLLCFEYLPNGDLDSYIKDPSHGLNWRHRYTIIKGICEGINHLHQINIVHLDLKPANILLDENLEPKISDFGISRSFEEDQTRLTATKVVGTMGYMAPEFLSHIITQKYDLYSLGVIIMEILTGEKGYQDVNVDNVVQSWIDRLEISEGISRSEQIRVCAEIGMECIEFNPANRPVSVKHIIERLAETESTKDCSRRFKMLHMGITCPDRIIYSLDTNQAKQWIITGEERGRVRIYNYETQKKIYSLKLWDKHSVMCVKFIERKQWFAASAKHGGPSIHVYSYETKMQRIMGIKATFFSPFLAVHPTEPYLMAMGSGTLGIWNWDNNWKANYVTTGFDEYSFKEGYQGAFSSGGTLATALDDCTVKVWSSIESALETRTSKPDYYILSGHSGRVNCLVFYTRRDKEYLVTASNDLTCKIWDVQKKLCLNTLDLKSPVMSILYQPDLEILITGSEDGSVHSWRAAGFSTFSSSLRPKGTINIGGGAIHSLACLMGRVVIGKEDGVAIMDIGFVDYGKKAMDIKKDEEETSKVTAGSSSEIPILEVHPLELCFPCEPNMSMPCSLQLANNKDDFVAYRLIDKSGNKSGRCLEKLKQYGIKLYGMMCPKSRYTWVLTREEEMQLAEEADSVLVVQSTISGSTYFYRFQSQFECDVLFREAIEMGNTVDEVVAIYVPGGDTISESTAREITSAMCMDEELCSICAHPTEPWIITGHANGDLRTWNDEAKKPMNSFKVSEQSVCTIKFIAGEKRILAGTSDGFIHVFDCVRVTEMQKITSFMCTLSSDSSPYSLAVHPVELYVVSTTMELWKYGNKSWKRQTKNRGSGHQVNQVAFTPNNRYFASAEKDGSVQFWGTTDRDKKYASKYRHLDAVNCLDFYKLDGVHYMISGSDDCTAKIWDLSDGECVHTLKINLPVISVLALPHRQCLVTGSGRGLVKFWNSTDFRLERIVHCPGGELVRGLVCSMGSRRVVIGQQKTIIVMDLDEEAAASHDGEAQSTVETHTPTDRDNKNGKRWWHLCR